MIMKQNINNRGGGRKANLAPQITVTEVIVEHGFAGSPEQGYPGGQATGLKNAWGDIRTDAYGFELTDAYGGSLEDE